MDLLVLLLVEMAVVEFLAVIVLLVMLSVKKERRYESAAERRLVAREVEREARAVANVGRRVSSQFI